MMQMTHAHNDIPIVLSRFRQYTSAQCDIALLDGEMVPRGRWQGTSQGASCAKSKVPFPVSWHITGSSVSRISRISENRLHVIMRKTGTRHRRQGKGRHRDCLGSGDATREKSAAIPRWSRHDGHSSNRSIFFIYITNSYNYCIHIKLLISFFQVWLLRECVILILFFICFWYIFNI